MLKLDFVRDSIMVGENVEFFLSDMPRNDVYCFFIKGGYLRNKAYLLSLSIILSVLLFQIEPQKT